jgi:hypothetical protein
MVIFRFFAITDPPRRAHSISRILVFWSGNDTYVRKRFPRHLPGPVDTKLEYLAGLMIREIAKYILGREITSHLA